MSEYLYLAASQFVGTKIAKIGVSRNPRDRLRNSFMTAPVELSEVLLRRFDCRAEADAWERVLFTSANRYRDHGEWVLDDAHLRKLWNSIDAGEPVDIGVTYAGRKVQQIDLDENRKAAFVQKLRAKVGPKAAAKISYDGDAAGFRRALVLARLSEGFGAEDIAVLDRIALDLVRDEISILRSAGDLARIYPISEGAA